MNILVIRTHRLGDVLQLTPMLEGMKKKYPGSNLTLLTGADMEDILSQNPYVDEIITIPEKEYRYELREKPERYAQVYNKMYDLVCDLKKKHFHLIINRQYEVGGVLAYLTGSPDVRGGTFSPDRGFFFDDVPSQRLFNSIKKDRTANRCNLVDWACHIAGVEPGRGRMTFCLSEPDRREAEDLLRENGAFDDPPVAIQMGAARSFRQWGADNFVVLIRWLTSAMNKTIVLLGTDSEQDQAGMVCRSPGMSVNRIINLTGKTTLKTLGGVLERCQCLITGDTGTMHMAAAVGTPVISLFYGTAYPWETGPYGAGHLILYADEPCAPCLEPRDCAFGQKCRNAITPEHVCRAFKIAEGLSDDECSAYAWGKDNVHLFTTRVRPGCEQVLIPIEEMNGGKEVCLFPRKPQRQELSKVKTLHTSVGRLLDKGEQIVQLFYSGEMYDFLEAVPEYVDRWSKIVAILNKGEFSHMNPNVLKHHLSPALHQACRAMEAGDYVTVVDLIRYTFAPILESGSERTPRDLPQGERATV